MTETKGLRSPVEVDTDLAEASMELRRAEQDVARAWANVHDDAGDRGKWNARRARTELALSHEEALEKAQKVAEDYAATYVGDQVRQGLEKLAKAQEAAEALKSRVSDLNAEYRGWSRFFLVQNTDGHIHRSMHCSTCHLTTQFAWLPDMSGRTEADVVAEHGALLCTVCFPSAPVEWTNLRELQAAAKDAGKCAGSGQYAELFNHDHAMRVYKYAECHVCHEVVNVTSTYKLRAHKAKAEAKQAEGFQPVKVQVNGYSETFKTERTAVIKLVEHLADAQVLGYRLDEAAVARLKEVTGISEEELAKKVAAKVKRYQADQRKWAQ